MRIIRQAYLMIGFLLLAIPASAQLGQPLNGIYENPVDLRTFLTGQAQFQQMQTLAPGEQIGPLFNGTSCGGCHTSGALGGGGLAKDREIRVRNRGDGAPPVQIFAVDNMLRLGPQTQGGVQIDPLGVQASPSGCQITDPNCNLSLCQTSLRDQSTYQVSLPICDISTPAFIGGGNCIAERESLPIFGDGLVEAVADSTFDSIAANQPSEIRGTIKMVTELGATHAGRFGWKNGHASLLGFAEDAYLNEMGITNPGNPLPNSTCAIGQQQFGVTLQVADDPEDKTDSNGRADVDRFADFMRALQPPRPSVQNASAQAGRRVFDSVGCNGCHVETMRTWVSPVAIVPRTTGGVPLSSHENTVLANVTFHPFGDYLLHDMGSLGDGITDGAAGPTMMRTMPLWGLHLRQAFLHDQRATDLTTAISLHDGQGKAASDAFKALSAAQQQQLLDFLNTL